MLSDLQSLFKNMRMVYREIRSVSRRSRAFAAWAATRYFFVGDTGPTGRFRARHFLLWSRQKPDVAV